MLALLVMALATRSAEGQSWDEIGDAPEGPVGIEGHQETVGLGPLNTIFGSLDVGANDHVDTYAIEVTDMSLFSVTISPLGLEVLANARTWLWNDFTRGGTQLVMANDNSPLAPGGLSPLLTDPSTWPGVQINAPGSVAAGGRYLLSISYFDNNPVDAMETALADLDNFPEALHGLAMAGPFSNWQNPGAPNVSSYQIQLTGVTYSVPEPGSLVIIIAALLLPVAKTRRHRRGQIE
jgi:hypothetical protein